MTSLQIVGKFKSKKNEIYCKKKTENIQAWQVATIPYVVASKEFKV